MKILPLLALAASCVLTTFAQTYRVQLTHDLYSNEPVPPPIKVTLNQPFTYDGMKLAELTKRFLGAKHQKEYEKALKDDPQQVGFILKILVEPSNTDPEAVIVKIEYSHKKLWYFCDREGSMKAYYETNQWTSTQEVPIGVASLIYSIEETRPVNERPPFWGDLPLLGRFFQTPGVSSWKREYFVTVSLLPEKKS